MPFWKIIRYGAKPAPMNPTKRKRVRDVANITHVYSPIVSTHSAGRRESGMVYAFVQMLTSQSRKSVHQYRLDTFGPRKRSPIWLLSRLLQPFGIRLHAFVGFKKPMHIDEIEERGVTLPRVAILKCVSSKLPTATLDEKGKPVEEEFQTFVLFANGQIYDPFSKAPMSPHLFLWGFVGYYEVELAT